MITKEQLDELERLKAVYDESLTSDHANSNWLGYFDVLEKLAPKLIAAARENVELTRLNVSLHAELEEEEKYVEAKQKHILKLQEEKADLRKRVEELERGLPTLQDVQAIYAEVQKPNQLNQTVKNLTGFEATDITPELMEAVRKYLDKQELKNKCD